MRKILPVLIIIIVSLLSGCSTDSLINGDGCLIGYYKEDEECIKNPDDLISFEDSFDVEDIATSYDFNSTSLNIYSTEIDKGVEYVNIEEFISMLDGGLIDLDITKSRNLVISHTIVTEEYEGELILEFNPLSNIIYYNDFNFSSILSSEYNIDYEYEVERVGGDYTAGNVEKIIDLDDYKFDIIKYDNDFYIPLYLANLFLSGDVLEVMEYEGVIYLVDDFTIKPELLESQTISTQRSTESAIEDSYYYTLLVLDHFYGLKEEHSSVIDNFKEEDIEDIVRIEDIGGIINSSLLLLDDAHTSIIGLGYNGDNLPQGYVDPNSTLLRFYTDLTNRGCLTISMETTLEEKTSYYVLHINEFSLDTRVELEMLLVDIDPNKEFYIDLSCNTGGNVVAVFDLMAYMSNEPFTIYSTNPSTGEQITDVYEPTVDKVLANNFHVFVSRSTFSAANLFTFLVKENNIAPVFGSLTSGGAAAVNVTVLPNNMVLTYSSNIVFTNEDFIPIDDGIRPDQEIDVDFDFEEAYSVLNSKFSNYSNYTIHNKSTSDLVDIEMETDLVDSDVNIEKYTVEVYDSITTDLIVRTYFYDSDFEYIQEINTIATAIDIVVKAEYTVNNISYSNTIYSEMFDTLPDYINENVPVIPTWTSFVTQVNSPTDKDFIKIEVDDFSVYSISVNKSLSGSHKIYSWNGEQLYTGNNFNLNPGTYYVEIDIPSAGSYGLMIESYVDDNTENTLLKLEEGDNSVDLEFDFIQDDETIEFKLEQNAIVNLSYNNLVEMEYKLLSEEGNLIYYLTPSEDDIILKDFVLSSGTYYLEFKEGPMGETTVDFNVSYIPEEINGKFDENTENFGVIQDGSNEITFEASWDQDIYIYNATENGYLAINCSDELLIYLVSIDEMKKYDYNEGIFVVEGLNYIRFTNYNGGFGETISDVEVTFRVDESDENSMIPISIGETFYTVIDTKYDVDYFTFSLVDQTDLEFISDGGHRVSFYVYDSNDNRVVYGYSDYQRFELPAGDYRLEVSGSFIHEVVTFEVLLQEFTLIDEEVDEIGLNSSYYTNIVLPDDDGIVFNGRIEERGDLDYFRIEIVEETTIYIDYVFEDGLVSIRTEDDKTILLTWNTVVLSEGVYYILFDSFDIREPTEYSFSVDVIT